jgi:carbohydrate-selective porin OprB
LDIRVGRFGAGDDFLASPLYTNFVNAAFNGNPGSIPINIPSFPSYPIATWGLQFKTLPLEQLYIMGGVYDSDVALARNHAHGVDFGIRGNAGAFVIGEIGYLRDQGQTTAGILETSRSVGIVIPTPTRTFPSQLKQRSEAITGSIYCSTRWPIARADRKASRN